MKIIKKAFFGLFYFLFIWASLYLQCLPATPNQNDLLQVKKLFLQLRFNSNLIQNLKGKSDQELFQMSCISKRVDCTQVLDLLKNKDPKFYKKLNL